MMMLLLLLLKKLITKQLIINAQLIDGCPTQLKLRTMLTALFFNLTDSFAEMWGFGRHRLGSPCESRRRRCFGTRIRGRFHAQCLLRCSGGFRHAAVVLHQHLVELALHSFQPNVRSPAHLDKRCCNVERSCCCSMRVGG